MIEGATERIMIPMLMDKVDKTLPDDSKLKSQYISVVEIGGAYAHHFYKFLDFLELRSLIITDIDSVLKDDATSPIKYKKCNTSVASHSTNAGLKQWLDKDKAGYLEIDFCVDLDDAKKETQFRRIAYQSAEPGFKYCGRSFEDAFMLANPKLFELEGSDDKSLEVSAFEKSIEVEKTNFALKYGVAENDWNVPDYIIKGLTWLAQQPNKISEDALEVMAEVVATVNDGNTRE